jgi:hypothetical protein
VLNHSAKAIEIEDIEVRVAALEAAAASGHPVEQTGAFSSLVERWADEMSRKRWICEIELPPLQGEPILVPTDEAIGLRLVRRN